MEASFFSDTRPETLGEPEQEDGFLVDLRLSADKTFTAIVNQQTMFCGCGWMAFGAQRKESGTYELDQDKVTFTLPQFALFGLCKCENPDEKKQCSCLGVMISTEVPAEWQRFTAQIRKGKLVGYPVCLGQGPEGKAVVFQRSELEVPAA